MGWLFGGGSAPAETGARPEIGTWNHLEASLGQRGTGKSTHQCARALELSREAGGAYVIGHSIGGRLPRKLPAELGGDELPIVYHETLAKLERGLRRAPDRWHILAPPVRADAQIARDSADDLIKFVIRFSRAIKKSAWQKQFPLGRPGERLYRDNARHDGVHAPPIILIIDEGIAIEAAGASRKEDNRWFLEFLYSLRHLHVALLYAIQDASARSWRILEQATILWVFAIRHAWALQSIQAAGATPEQVQEIRRLQKYKFVKLDLTEPIGESALATIEAKTPEGTPA